MMYTCEVQTPIGTMALVAEDKQVLRKYQRAIEQYFKKKRPKLSFSDFDVQGTSFQQKVLKAIFEIPYGQTISYSELARRAGNPRAVRAVASVVAQNKHYILIPCHRVIRSDGTIGEYGAGSDRKRWLLRHEGSMV